MQGNQNHENFVSAALKKITEVLVKPMLKETTSQFAGILKRFFQVRRLQSVLIFSINHPCRFLYGIFSSL